MVCRLVKLHDLGFLFDGQRTPKPVTRTLISSLLVSSPTAGAREPIAFQSLCQENREFQKYESQEHDSFGTQDFVFVSPSLYLS